MSIHKFGEQGEYRRATSWRGHKNGDPALLDRVTARSRLGRLGKEQDGRG